MRISDVCPYTPVIMFRRPFSVHVFLYRRTAAGALEFMLFLRKPREAFGLPAFWQGITGALDVGESFSDGARREVKEESGLEGIDLLFTGFVANYPIRPAWRVHFGNGPDHVEERAAYGEVAVDAQPRLSEEHSTWGWFAADQASRLLVTGHNRQSFESVLKALMV
ncbi:MAG: NUDIX domain-containing protein [Gammaproteobacteria bacterium]|nr:NUDIX domain-containing protein [Gammaproteobacteria bacterium]